MRLGVAKVQGMLVHIAIGQGCKCDYTDAHWMVSLCTRHCVGGHASPIHCPCQNPLLSMAVCTMVSGKVSGSGPQEHEVSWPVPG